MTTMDTAKPSRLRHDPGTHRAIVRSGTYVHLETHRTPAPRRDELVLANEVVGLCGTDIQMLRGLRDDPVPIIGHEGLSTVHAAGCNVDSRFAPGTPVIVNPTHPRNPQFLLGHNVDGLLQERTLLPTPAVQDGMVLPLTDVPEPTVVPLLEPLAAVRYSFSILRRFAPTTLVVVGDGTIGHLAVRIAKKWLGPRIRTVLVHHTELGRTWSAHSRFPADTLLREGEHIAVEGAVAAVIATPRDATLPALESVVGLRCQDLTVDLLGGLPADAGTPLLPGANLSAIRAANCGGLPTEPALSIVPTAAGEQIRLFGHRGVHRMHLLAAADELIADPDRYRDLITHVASIEEAARIMGDLARSRDRVVSGRRLVKLAVRMTGHPDSQRRHHG